jgi:hypothetical protein
MEGIFAALYAANFFAFAANIDNIHRTICGE